MKTTRTTCFFLIITLLQWFVPAALPLGQQLADARAGLRGSLELPRVGRSFLELHPTTIGAHDYHSDSFIYSEAPPDAESSGGIREEIPDRYKARYQRWKTEFLSTETGRKQWETYAQNQHFTLTITISSDNQQGASTGKYKWSDSGELVGATVSLGYDLDEGFPDPVYYPVMNSLGWSREMYMTSGDILAATKIAHEFGHVIQSTNADGRLYRLQNKLMPIYRTIFLNNGHNIHDPRLVALAQQMGGTCVEVWEDREYWGEANAMLYLRDRVLEKSFRCYLFARIKRTVEEYAENYAERFERVGQSKPDLCGWQ